MKRTQEQIDRLAVGIEALRENHRNGIKAVTLMRNPAGGRCCLCVLQDSAIEQGADIARDEVGDTLPSQRFAEFYGFGSWNPAGDFYPDPNPDLEDATGKTRSAAGWNDGLSRSLAPSTHEEIADLFEAHNNETFTREDQPCQ